MVFLDHFVQKVVLEFKFASRMRSQSSSNGASHPRVSLGQDRGILVSKRFHTFFLDGYLYFKARLKLSLAAWWYKMAWRALIEQDVLRILRWSRNFKFLSNVSLKVVLWALSEHLARVHEADSKFLLLSPLLLSFGSDSLHNINSVSKLELDARLRMDCHWLENLNGPGCLSVYTNVEYVNTMRRYACPRGGITHTGVKSCRSSWGWSLITVLC